MRRREFITLLGGAAMWPLTARAHQPATPIIGFMSARSPDDSTHLMAAFHQGLTEGGFVEGQNVVIEFRWARGEYDRLPGMAADLVSRQVKVLVAVGGEPSALAAKRATSTIPIVFGIGSDPVFAGLVDSVNRPGANVTGATLLTTLMEPKRFGLLRELSPGVALVGVLLNPNFPPAAHQLQALEEAARSINQGLVVTRAASDAELDAAFTALIEAGAGVAGRGGSVFRCAARPDHRLCAAPASAGHLSISGICCGRGTAQLWAQHHRRLQAVRRIHGQNPEWREARRASHLAANQVRACDQPSNGEVAWHQHFRQSPLARRRDNRIDSLDVRMWHRASVGRIEPHFRS